MQMNINWNNFFTSQIIDTLVRTAPHKAIELWKTKTVPDLGVCTFELTKTDKLLLH